MNTRQLLAAREDRGSVEVTLYMPILMLLVMAAVQIGLYAHAHQTAESIATHALAASRTVDGTAQQGQARAEQVGEQLAGDLLTEVVIDVEREATTARVTVQATVPSLLPAVPLRIHHQQSAPVERTTPYPGAAP